MTKIRTNDGHVMEIELALIQDCSLLKMASEDLDEIPLPNIDAAIMETIVRFFNTGSIPEFELFGLYDAANYLGYEKLQDAIAMDIAESLKGKPVDEIRKMFNLPEKELLDALKYNGFAKNENVTLDYVYSNTLQDGQYAAEARESANVLAKYLAKYGKMTIKEIRTL